MFKLLWLQHIQVPVPLATLLDRSIILFVSKLKIAVLVSGRTREKSTWNSYML